MIRLFFVVHSCCFQFARGLYYISQFDFQHHLNVPLCIFDIVLIWRSLGSITTSTQKFVTFLKNHDQIYNVIYDIKNIVYVPSTLPMTFLAYANKLRNVCDLFDVRTVAGYNISLNVCIHLINLEFNSTVTRNTTELLRHKCYTFPNVIYATCVCES